MSPMQSMRVVAVSALAGALAAALVSGAVVWAHDGDASRIHSCVTAAGVVQITADPTPFGNPSVGCSGANGEHALDWGVQGPQGPVGPAGPQGLTGVRGPAGPSGTISPTFVRGTDWDAPARRGAERTMTGFRLQPGKYLVIGFADTRINDNTPLLICSLHQYIGRRGHLLDETATKVGDSDGIVAHVSLMAPVEVAPRTTSIVRLRCRTFGAPGDRTLVSDPRLVAVPVTGFARP
jgi:hypothetical protein